MMKSFKCAAEEVFPRVAMKFNYVSIIQEVPVNCCNKRKEKHQRTQEHVSSCWRITHPCYMVKHMNATKSVLVSCPISPRKQFAAQFS